MRVDPDTTAALFAEQFRYDTDPRGGDVYPEIRKAIREAIEADRQQIAALKLTEANQGAGWLQEARRGEA